MPVTIESLGIDKLSRDERLALAQDILDSVAAENPPPKLSDARRRELERRAAEDDASPDDVTPWAEVQAETLARLRGS